MKREIGITIRETLQLESLKNAKIVAGVEGLGRVVKYVNIMEVPDIVKWVREGELLLSTIYSIKDDEEAQRQLIPTLAERGLAGMAIKPGLYIEKIPALMLDQANKYNFPIIELPLDASFSDLMDTILSEILNDQAVFLKKSLDTHEMLMDVVLKGGGLAEIAAAISRLIKTPVALLNQNLEILAINLIHKLQKEDLFEYDQISKAWVLKKELENSTEHIGRFKLAKIQINENIVRQFSIPIMISQENHGYIFVWDIGEKLEMSDLLIVERSVIVALNQNMLLQRELKQCTGI
ncbi:MAG: PucR family transcriptional regulator ligand-binding domain-containing protein [Halanaerobiales bacterium]|nr:PucR family transcriptional regulator ligand-binding domain-containing protein [Halanaerobiales bacterium]